MAWNNIELRTWNPSLRYRGLSFLKRTHFKIIAVIEGLSPIKNPTLSPELRYGIEVQVHSRWNFIATRFNILFHWTIFPSFAQLTVLIPEDFCPASTETRGESLVVPILLLELSDKYLDPGGAVLIIALSSPFFDSLDFTAPVRI